MIHKFFHDAVAHAEKKKEKFNDIIIIYLHRQSCTKNQQLPFMFQG